MSEEIRRVLAMASGLCSREDHEEAEKLIRDALEHYPGDLDLKAMLGIILSRTERDREAESVLRSVLKRDPDHEQATSTLGRLLDNSLRTEEAESLYRGLLERRPASHSIADDLCRMLVEEDRPDEAYRIAKTHADRYPNEYEAYSAIQHVLESIEDIIREMTEETDFDRRNLARLASNLIEQFEVIRRMEMHVGKDSLRAGDHIWELDEEVMRIAGELEYVEGEFKKHRTALPANLQAATRLVYAERNTRAKSK
ncbi:MAG: hypothetical protein C4K49_09040 [Candidatus Thorarchaeota archaeon]|nr:MAG: hypothetical protein C4K49_09040 [Candidatus Thorarchaeota archaeon]